MSQPLLKFLCSVRLGGVRLHRLVVYVGGNYAHGPGGKGRGSRIM